MESLLFSVSVFLAGVLSFFSPCIFPLLPVYIGILLDSEDKPRTVRFLGREIMDLLRLFVLLREYHVFSSF